MSLMRPLSSIQQDLNRAFYDLEREFLSPLTRRPEAMESLMQTVWAPPIDIIEEPNEVIVKAQIPGIKPENIEVEVDNNMLTLRGEMKRTEEEKKKNFYRREIVEGTFHRQVQLPTEIQPEKASAKFEHGMLIVNIPKAQQTKRHKVKVNT